MSHTAPSPAVRADPQRTRTLLIVLTLLGFALRVTGLDRLGLSYDEAASALMARPAPWEIIEFHWRAPFEHPPLWSLLVHAWSHMAGQSEVALRWLPALAGSLFIPLTWIAARHLLPTIPHAPPIAALLAVLSPVLVYYSQDARMYSLVVMAALLTTLLAWRLTRPQPGTRYVALFVLTGWVMTGLHYVSALVLALQAGALLGYALLARRSLPWRRLFLAYALAGLPIACWLVLAPSFRTTLQVVLRAAEGTPIGPLQFLRDYGRDIGFAAIRWSVPAADWSLLLAPFALLGLGVILIRAGRDHPGAYLVSALALLPPLVGALALPTLATRYILFTVPFTLMAVAAVVAAAGQRSRIAGLVTVAPVLIVSLLALNHYTTSYVKSDYRRMVTELAARLNPQHDLIVLEAPRQHLLARYYFSPAWTFTTVPEAPDTPFWPVTLPRVVPEVEDDRVQSWLARYRALWIVYAGESEVDPGEFLAKYVTAVAYRQDCRQYLDVRTCRYISPVALAAHHHVQISATYGDELVLERAALTLYPAATAPESLLAQLDWYAARRPSVDYKASLRVRAADGQTLAQADELPIGTLLPPTTWGAGDRKPGYLAVSLPASLPPGDHVIELAVYNAADLVPIEALHSGDRAASLRLAILRVGDTMQLLPAP